MVAQQGSVRKVFQSSSVIPIYNLSDEINNTDDSYLNGKPQLDKNSNADESNNTAVSIKRTLPERITRAKTERQANEKLKKYVSQTDFEDIFLTKATKPGKLQTGKNKKKNIKLFYKKSQQDNLDNKKPKLPPCPSNGSSSQLQRNDEHMFGQLPTLESLAQLSSIENSLYQLEQQYNDAVIALQISHEKAKAHVDEHYALLNTQLQTRVVNYVAQLKQKTNVAHVHGAVHGCFDGQ